jgi:D-alanyl-D-alanine carboxypeptidase|tara:strand:- start:401 stop:1315 length:915 start_codon:yes stop_codon:yes gene_type:complete
MTTILSLLLISLSVALPTFPIVEHSAYISDHDIRAERVVPQSEVAHPPVKEDVKSLGPRLSAQSAIVVDSESSAVLFEKWAHKVHPMASIVKIMTALVFLEQNPDLTLRIEMTEEDNREGGDDFIKPGESATLLSFLRASLLGSANNATIVLSRSTELSQVEFVSAMNTRANELGMRDTIFIEPTGLDPKNTSTARDIVRLLSESGKNERIKEILGTNRSTIRVYPRGLIRQIVTTNHLMGTIIPVEYGKTGYLDESLYNLGTVVSTSQGNELFVVVLGSQTNEERIQDAKNLTVWAERTYKWE